MKYAIIYASKSGNTKLLAEAILNALKEFECVYIGNGEDFDSQECDIIFLGSWCDKGTIADTLISQMQKLENKKVALFGTCGFGGNQKYFDDVAKRMCNELPNSCKIIDTFICQGKMPISIRKRYEGMLYDEKTKNQAQALISNFDQAMTHPDDCDIKQAKQFALHCIKGKD